MRDLQELLVTVKSSNITVAQGQANFLEILSLVDLADEQGLLKNVTRTLSKRRGDLYDSCIAVTLKDGLSVGGEMWLEQHATDA